MGTGHVMRSCAIAESAINHGIECLFAGDLGGIAWLENVVTNIGFSQLIQASALTEISTRSDVLILDTYLSSESWVLELPWRGKVAVVDPITPDFKVDIRIHPGLESEWPSNGKSIFLGEGRYLLVRKDFRKIEVKQKRDNLAREILVIGGGTDPFGFCSSFANELKTFSGDFNIRIITDTPNYTLNDRRFTFHNIGANFLELLTKADVIFSPASSLALEVVASGLPLGVVCAAENQHSNYQKLISRNFAIDVGMKTLNGSWHFHPNNVELLIKSHALRKRLVENCSKNFDLLGADRLIANIFDRFA
jgi:spore coat polysaccharide biosynthesis predicted glycosyltransferase SpsG